MPMHVEQLRYTRSLLLKPPPRGLGVETSLKHFAIVTYYVDSPSIQAHLHPRFEPVCLLDDNGSRQALISVVTFFDRDFRFVTCPWLKWSFGQTNYRSYVLDTETGEQVVWFFGTCLDSVAFVVPRYCWKLPWHRAQMTFDCLYDGKELRYTKFQVTTHSDWAPGRLKIRDSGRPLEHLPGFSSLEAGSVFLTHPLKGYYFRRDQSLGSYTIWHDRSNTTVGKVEEARYPLLQSLDLVQEGDLKQVHSTLIQPSIDFTIYLPPRKVAA